MKNSQMTKANYELIAYPFKRQIDYIDSQKGNVNTNHQRWLAINVMARDMAEVLSWNDPKFDQHKFLQACGVVSEFNNKTKYIG